jgi:hypothetical protein
VAEPGGDRVDDHVAARLAEVRLVLDDAGGEAVAENVAVPVVAVVVGAGVSLVQALHAG